MDAVLSDQLQQLRRAIDAGAGLQADALLAHVMNRHPDAPEVLLMAARLAARRGDLAQTGRHLARAHQLAPQDAGLAFDRAMLAAEAGDLEAAIRLLIEQVQRTPAAADAWLLLGHLQERQGRALAALKAWFQAVERAQARGFWLSEQTTPPTLLPMVVRAIDALKTGRPTLFRSALDSARQAVGSDELKRVDRALAAYLGEREDAPPDPRQRPKFLYFPGLPDLPYHDPALQPWAGRLLEGFKDIQQEALELLGDASNFESFLNFAPGTRTEDYVSGAGPKPAWDAFFFYRHGQRFDAHHARCPRTSAVLDSLDLCHVRGQAPEVCFSVLAPGSTIMPHHGVTNTRLVMHLPLKVPADCALNIVGVGEHRWREGELMMFDDTYQHEAWNRSDQTRVILLMDCWNPHLAPAERLAVRQLIECISDFENEPV